MWLFNPGNPTRGSTLMAEEDGAPSRIINHQISLPPFFRFDAPAGGELEELFPGAVGSRVCKRFFPNGKLKSDMSDGPNVFTYTEIPSNSDRMYRIFFGGSLPSNPEGHSSYYYQLVVNGEIVYEGVTLTLGQVWALLSEHSGVTPTNFNVRSVAIFDRYYFPPYAVFPDMVTFSVPADKPLSLDSTVRSIHYGENGYEQSRGIVGRERSSEEDSGWHVEWMGGVIGAIQRPFLMYNQWIIGDLASRPPAWEGPNWFDAMSPVDLDLYEIVIADTPNPYGPDGVVRGQFLGKTTMYPAWS